PLSAGRGRRRSRHQRARRGAAREPARPRRSDSVSEPDGGRGRRIEQRRGPPAGRPKAAVEQRLGTRLMIGLELFDSRALAVMLDDDGKVIRRASAGVTSDLGAAAIAALDEIRPATAESVGVTCATPDAPAVTSAIAALDQRFPGVGPATASGVAAAVAESWVGVGRGFKDVVFLSVGAPATGGIVRGGSPIDGGHRRAASVAWLALNPVEREDYRKIGCLEAEVAAAGIVRRLIWRIKSGDHSIVLKAAGGTLGAITVDHILDA